MTRPEMESRRLSAALDLKAGLKVTAVAKKWGVSRITADRWKRALKCGETLKSRKGSGRPSRLLPWQQSKLRRMYSAAMECGERWTQRTVQEEIKKHFGIEYEQDHCGWILHKLRREQF